jgi:hypothetical protein
MSKPAKTVYVSRFAFWAPGLHSAEEWQEWAEGKREIEQSSAAPALEFTDPLFRRRLSQLSKMTIQVLHDIMPIGEQTKTVFVSFRGEIGQQLKINRMLALEGDLSPAAFSQSVFNTPPAMAAIALDLRAGYTAIYPGNDRFDAGFLAAAAPLLSGAAERIALVYADELCPAEYGYQPLAEPGSLPGPGSPSGPFGFAALLEAEGPGVPVSPGGDSLASPRDFLKYLVLNGARR